MGFLLVLCFAILAPFLSSSQTPFLLVNSTPSNSTLTDKEALLSFKSLITTDLYNTLSSWDQNSPLCNWTGVVCNNFNQRVVGLDLRDLELSGTISPYLGNLSFLHSLHLQNNDFVGTLPDQIGYLSRLQVLNVSYNRIEGAIPLNISRCLELSVLDLTENEISGKIPPELERLSKLQVLKLSRNKLSGAIPPSIGNLSSLTNLDLITNTLGGTIPNELGHLQNLKQLALTDNELIGTVPPSLFNISSLVNFIFAKNRLWGEIPSDVGDKLPNLLVFNFCFNKFTGGIPVSLHNLTKIQTLRISNNFLVGSVPPGLGNLPDLRTYNIGFNRIVSSGDAGLSFITSLTNSTRLEYLALDENLLEGVIPESIGNLSTPLTKLYLGGNQIYGRIPASISRLSNLALLNLSHNSFSGEIPPEIGLLKELQKLGLAGNKISGEIPASLGNLNKLSSLEMYGNELVGRIPTTFGNYQRLLSLDLSNNRLNGSIPKEIFKLSSLTFILNLSKNSLSGPLPQEIEVLEKVVTIDLSDNRLSGSIPGSIGNCRSLENLFMARNLFSGRIPNSLGEVKALDTLDLSLNQLSGPIPHELQKLQVLQLLNLTFNNLEGEVPKDGVFRNTSRFHLEGNLKLCLSTACENSGLHERRSTTIGSNKILIASSSIVVGVFVGVLLCIIFYRRRSKLKILVKEDSIKGQHQIVSYQELCMATGNFNTVNLIGSGSFGSVYRGILGEDMTVAVKVLDLGKTGASKSFFAECEALRNVRHRNLVKLITLCSSVDFGNLDFQALVYEFMGNGNLDDWIRGRRRHVGGDGLNVLERLNVAIDIACAMDYLHHDCNAPVVHCDLKPSNILLCEDMTAKVGDFGLARKVVEAAGDQQSITTTNGLKGSIGYIPPEYGMGGKASTRGDVYSYGIMLLQLFTGRSPTHESFTEGLNLVKWVLSAFPTNIMEVLDPELLLLMGGVGHRVWPINLEIQQKCLVLIIDVGLSCTTYLPDARIRMRDVLHKLKGIRDSLIKPTLNSRMS